MSIGKTPTKAVVNLSTKKYWTGQKRLIKSLLSNTDADILLFTKESDVGAPLHQDNNYAFKVYAIERAKNIGFSQVLWLDASMYVLKDLTPIFEIIANDGYFFQYSGWKNCEWTNERTKEYFGTDEGLMLSSGVLGLNFEMEISNKFFERWKQSMLDGQFNGSWSNHRHDQASASIIAHQLKMKLQDGNSFFEYAKPEDSPSSESVLMFANGIC